MNILMMTNTYLPHVGGVANSVSAFTKELQIRGHRVIVVAPEYKDQLDDHDIIRIPAIQNFNGSDFSVVLQIPTYLENHLEGFKPDIVHSHHPFLVGSTAMRIAKKYDVPLVYTQHTMFEEYTHYVPIGLDKMKQFVISLSTGYANMSDQVIAPSQSTAAILKSRGVTAPIEVIPTGVDVDKFSKGSGIVFRKINDIPPNAFVIGHAGRLAPEKNLNFLAAALADFLKIQPNSHLVMIGYGPLEHSLEDFFLEKNLGRRVHFVGKLVDQYLIDAYHAMNVFAFSSKSETQGLVLVEAMAAGVPVIALDAPGVREVVIDALNGYLLTNEYQGDFVRALNKFYNLPAFTRKNLIDHAKLTAKNFSIDICVSKLLNVYEKLKISKHHKDESAWQRSIDQIKTEWDLFTNLTSAVGDALKSSF